MAKRRKKVDPSGKNERTSLLVLSKRCNECLFSKNKIVDDDRRADVLATCEERDQYFICHKATLKDRTAVCRGFYDERSAFPIRLAKVLGLVHFIDEKDL